MMASLLEMVVYLIVNLLAVKMVFFRKGSEKPLDESVTWKSAVDSMEIMETRLQQLQERDLKQQERGWAMEDQIRDLQHRLSTATKELLLARFSPEETGPPDDDHGDQDDDLDYLDSIPPN